MAGKGNPIFVTLYGTDGKAETVCHSDGYVFAVTDRHLSVHDTKGDTIAIYAPGVWMMVGYGAYPVRNAED